MRTKILMTLVALMTLSSLARAEDVYNFYFQKSGDKKKEEVIQVKEQETPVAQPTEEEIVVVPDDVLLVPENWSPVRKKKVYVRESDVEEQATNEIKTEKKKEKKGRSRSGWSMNVGIGGLDTNVYGVGLDQNPYVIGGRYHMSRYFDVNSELHVANGDYKYDGYNYQTDDSLGPQMFIGLGVTPIHLNVFGGEFLEIGIDGGVAFGDRSIMNINSGSSEGAGNALYLGPRLAMNFGDHLSLVYSLKRDLDSEADFTVHSLAMSYRW